jgi:nitronate monooxygenase/enoyl-[acyl-carrier protein] reductase II
MLHTPLCDLLGIEHPIVQAAIWPATSPKLVAAVSNAGALGSLGAVFESADRLRQQIAQVRALTDRPFAVNHVVPLLNEEAFAVTLEAGPAVISFALGDPGDLVARAHDAGATVLHQVHTVRQAEQAAQRGVDGIIAQGSEAGGQGMVQGPSTMVLVPQVVDAVAPILVLAAGGVADGRGLAAALVLGAQGANIGTRFLASEEASVAETWKQALLTTASEETVRFEVWREIMPTVSPSAYPTVPRVLRTPFVERWQGRAGEVQRQAEEIRGKIMEALRAGRAHELVPFTGQTAGLVRDILPAAAIVDDIIAEAEQALSGAMRRI